MKCSAVYRNCRADLSILESPLTQMSMYEPESEDDAEIWSGDTEETAGKIAELLQEKWY